MNDYTKFREYIEGFLSANFSTVPIVYENAHLEYMYEEHIELTDQGVESNLQLEMGLSSPSLIEGILIVQIFTTANTGTVKARAIATELTTLLTQTFASDSVHFENPILTAVGLVNVEDVNLYQHNLSFPYKYFYAQIDS